MATKPEASVLSSEESFIVSLVHSVWKQRCLSIIVELKIPELICNSEETSISIKEIAAKSGCKSHTQLYPVLRLLAQFGIGKELKDKHFAKNKALELLRRDKGPSLGHFVAYECSDEQFSALRFLPACIKNDVPAFVLEHGMTTFEYMNSLDKSPYEESKTFEGSSKHRIGSAERRKEFTENYSNYNAYFTSLATLPNEQGLVNVYTAFPWSTCGTLVDIGGSSGQFLATILKLPGCEHIKGIVVELPAMVDNAKANFNELGLESHRLEFVKQDLSKPLQDGLHLEADTLIMKNFLIIFAKNDELMSTILRRSLDLLSSNGGRILIIEFCCPEPGDTEHNVGINGLEFNSQSIQRLSIGVAYVWSRSEWKENLSKAGSKLGLRLSKVYDTFEGGSTIFELLYEPKK